MFEGSASSDARASYTFYLKESSGIRFQLLARFAQPMLELFDVEPHHWSLPESVPDDDQLLEVYSSALAAAEMFWSYFTLDVEMRKRFLPELKSYFIGATPVPHEEADFLLLVDCMRTEWEKISTENGFVLDRANAMKVLRSETAENSQAPDLETLALFGEPLMDDPALLEDPDRLGEIMTLVNDYWNLARADAASYPVMLKHIVQKHGHSAAERKKLTVQAQQMVARYRKLFTGNDSGRNKRRPEADENRDPWTQ